MNIAVPCPNNRLTVESGNGVSRRIGTSLGGCRKLAADYSLFTLYAVFNKSVILDVRTSKTSANSYMSHGSLDVESNEYLMLAIHTEIIRVTWPDPGQFSSPTSCITAPSDE